MLKNLIKINYPQDFEEDYYYWVQQETQDWDMFVRYFNSDPKEWKKAVDGGAPISETIPTKPGSTSKLKFYFTHYLFPMGLFSKVWFYQVWLDIVGKDKCTHPFMEIDSEGDAESGPITSCYCPSCSYNDRQFGM